MTTVNTQNAAGLIAGPAARRTEMEFVKVKILRTCAVGGKHLEVGAVITVSEDTAKELYAMGRAEPAEVEKAESDPAGDAKTPDKGKK